MQRTHSFCRNRYRRVGGMLYYPALQMIFIAEYLEGPCYDPTYRPGVGHHYVDGYYRNDGTWVNGHNRTNKDDSFWNNWGSDGNTNPYTGRIGSKRPPSSSSSIWRLSDFPSVSL